MFDMKYFLIQIENVYKSNSRIYILKQFTQKMPVRLISMFHVGDCGSQDVTGACEIL